RYLTALESAALAGRACALGLVDQRLDLITVAAALRSHRVDRVVDVQESEATPDQAVTEHPDRSDRLLHREVTALTRELERAEHEDSVVACDEVRRRYAPHLEQLEDGVEVLPETVMARVRDAALGRRERGPVFAVVVEQR